ncbi:unnamed protein product [Clonostachys rosea f. rosea IK726]|uniref:Uncharacterized protein n=1 Tax=Clonostachys rosea f. rosea IK726 TaxID=1349383 RepID=A0ACA9UM13_BIOOC|nr:unnamed protein product [Clonostachys rosea f. rosea IK726]
MVPGLAYSINSTLPTPTCSERCDLGGRTNPPKKRQSNYQRCGLSVLAEPKESVYIAALVLVSRPSGVQSCVISIKPAGPAATGDGAISVSSATKSIVWERPVASNSDEARIRRLTERSKKK